MRIEANNLELLRYSFISYFKDYPTIPTHILLESIENTVSSNSPLTLQLVARIIIQDNGKLPTLQSGQELWTSRLFVNKDSNVPIGLQNLLFVFFNNIVSL